MTRKLLLLAGAIALIVLLSGCCNWEEEDMSKPRGKALLGSEFTVLLSVPVAGVSCECYGRIPRSEWINCQIILAMTWNPPEVTYQHDVDYTQYIGKTLQLWWTLDGEDESGWTRFPDDEWEIVFIPGRTTVTANIGAKVPVNGDFFMILMDGPDKAQCLWPSVSPATPI